MNSSRLSHILLLPSCPNNNRTHAHRLTHPLHHPQFPEPPKGTLARLLRHPPQSHHYRPLHLRRSPHLRRPPNRNLTHRPAPPHLASPHPPRQRTQTLDPH